MPPDQAWEPLRLSREGLGTRAALRSLLAREAASIVVDDFWPREACEALVEAARRRGLRKTFGGRNVVATSSGIYVHDYKVRAEAEYLDDVPLANEERRLLLAGLPDPTGEVLELLGQAWPAAAALASAGGRPYSAGVIRVLQKSTTHNDWAPRDLGNGWSLRATRRQLSWHLYLSAPEGGGEFLVWRRGWEEPDERFHKLPGADLGYDEAFLSTFPLVTEPPAVGRFVLFETRNYHAFRGVTGGRDCLVISSFLSVTGESEPLLFW